MIFMLMVMVMVMYEIYKIRPPAYLALHVLQGPIPEMVGGSKLGNFNYEGGESGPEPGQTENDASWLLLCIVLLFLYE
jgi:hypothetical protein